MSLDSVKHVKGTSLDKQYTAILQESGEKDERMDFYIDDDEFEMEEDKRRILAQLIKKYDSFDSLKTQEQLTSLSEALLEFELERVLKRKRDFIQKRASSHLNPQEKQTMTKIDMECDYQAFRKRRQDFIDNISKKPDLTYPKSHWTRFEQETRLAVQRRNYRSYMMSQMSNFYDNWITGIKLQKYKLLHRWERFSKRVDKIERTEKTLRQRMNRLDSHLDFATKRLSSLHKAHAIVQEKENAFEERDFQIFLRNTIVKMRSRKKLDMFYKKIQWVSFTERQSLFQKAFDTEFRKKDIGCPLMTITLGEIEEQLEELKHCFDLTQAYDDNGQEFLFRVGKRFSAVFNAQTESWNFSSYPYPGSTNTATSLSKSNPDQTADDDIEEPSKPQRAGSMHAVYLKPATWLNCKIIEPRIASWQEEQSVLLREVDNFDVNLSVEATFLQTLDLNYASKRLREQAESHIQRAFVKAQYDNSSALNIDNLEIEGGRSTSNKVSAVHLLRYIRVREFKRKLLDILNYMRSIQRRLLMDSCGVMYKEKDPSFIKQFFADPSDFVSYQGHVFDVSCIMNRDDEYFLDKKKDLIVKDCFQVNIMYDVAISDLEQLEDRLLRIGTHFISKNIDLKREGIQIDRMLVLEDLYESEAWYQDGKRKLIDCYMEAYEHCHDIEDQRRLAQIIVDIIHTLPNIDLHALYFSESYASEIISLELQHSLLKDIIKTQMKDEKSFIKRILQTKSIQPNGEQLIDPGLPDDLNDGEMTTIINLFPGTSPVGIFDFYSSLSHVSYLHETIETCVSDMISSFHITNPVAVNSLRRTILQQAVVEWKLLTKEDKIQKDIKIRMSDERANVEDTILLERPGDLLNLIDDIIREEEKLGSGSISVYLGREDSNLTEGGFEISLKGSIAFQIYSNAVEMLFLWKNLLDQLYETDVLNKIYVEQGRLVGLNIDSSLDPMNFEDNGSEKKTRPKEVLAYKTQTLSHLAISEFDSSMSNFTFNTPDGISKVLHSVGLDELRHTFQFQVSLRILLEIATRFNQVPIDEYYVSARYSNVFITSVSTKNPYDINRSYTLDVSTLRNIFLNINTLKFPHRKRALEQYQRVSSDSLTKGTRPTMIRKRLRELKFRLAEEYCQAVVSSAQPFLLKYEIAMISNETRSILAQMNEDNGFTIGQEEHQANKHLIAKDGQIINPLYMPHYMQIIRIQFIHITSDEDEDDDPTAQYLVSLYDIFQRNYMLLQFIAAHLQMTMRSSIVIEQGVWSSEQISQYTKRFASELNHLRQPENPSAIIEYTSSKCQLLFNKTLLTLKNLKDNLLLRSQVQNGVEAISKAIQDLVQKDKDNKYRNPFSEFWPTITHFPEERKKYFQELKEIKTIPEIPLHFLRRFLLMLSESERNYYTVEEMNIELLLEDLLQEESLYSTSMPEKATTIQLEFLQLSVLIWQLKENFMLLITRDCDEETKHDPKQMDEMFHTSITRKAKRLYDKELKIREVLVHQRTASTLDEVSSELQLKKRREVDFRKKQLQVITQEINKILINDSIHDVSAECSQMQAEIRLQPEVDDSGVSNDFDGKQRIFDSFVATIMARGVRTRNKSGESEVTVYEKDMELAIDLVGQKIREWNEEKINEIKSNCISLLDFMKKQSFNLEMKLGHMQYIRELDKKSFKRRLQSEVADKNYDLVFRVDSLTRENSELRKQIANIAEEVRKQEQIKYEELVTKLEKEVILTKGQFAEYKRSFYQDMEKKFADVKDTTLAEIAKQKDSGSAFKNRALQIVLQDNEVSHLKMKVEDLKSSHLQLQVLQKLKLITQESKYLKLIRKAEEEKEEVKKRFFGNTEKIEAREQMLRKELVKTQEQLSNTEMEVEQLKKDLQLQIKNKQKLVNWKVKNAQLLDELEEKVDKYERWNQFDVDKLVLELEKTKKEVQQYHRLKSRLDQKSDLVETRSKKTIETLQKKLTKEQKMKRNALSKLNTALGSKQENSDSGEWQKRYFDLSAELQSTRRELELFKNHFEMMGIEIPHNTSTLIETGRSSRTDSVVYSSRPTSAKGYSSRSVTPKGGFRQPPLDLAEASGQTKKNETISSLRGTPSTTPKPSRLSNSNLLSSGSSRPMSIVPSYHIRPTSASSSIPKRSPTPISQRPNTSSGTRSKEPLAPMRRASSAGVIRPNANSTTLTVPNFTLK